MTKDEFLKRLQQLLKQLPPDDRQRHLEYYSELIEDKIEDGMPLYDAVASLGTPEHLAAEILHQTPLPVLVRSAVRPKRGWTGLSIALIILGSPLWLSLLLAAVAVLITVVACIWSVVVALLAVDAAILAAGLAVVILSFAANGMAGILMVFGLGLILLGLGLVAIPAIIELFRLMARASAATFRAVKSLFIRKEDAA